MRLPIMIAILAVFRCAFQIFNLLADLDSFTKDFMSWNSSVSRVLVKATDTTIKIWICPNFLMKTLDAHTAAVNDVVWHRDGRYLASVSTDATAIVWKAPVGPKYNQLISNCNALLCCDFHPRRSRLALGSAKRYILIWNYKKQKHPKLIKAHYGRVTGLQYNRTGELLISCGSDGACSIWNSHSGRRIKYFNAGNRSITSFVRFSPSGRFVLKTQLNNSLSLVHYSTGNVLNTYTGHINFCSSISSDIFTTPGQSNVIAGSEDNCVYIWDLDTSQLIYKLYGHRDAVKCVASHPNRKIIASGSKDGTIIIWYDFS